jgi:hypothetical protein
MDDGAETVLKALGPAQRTNSAPLKHECDGY